MTWLPERKVLSGGLAGVISWAVEVILTHAGVLIPPDIEAGLPALIGVLLAYFVPSSDRDIVTKLNDRLIKMAQDDPDVPVTKPK